MAFRAGNDHSRPKKQGDTGEDLLWMIPKPGGPVERTIIYQAPFFKPDREEDYAIAWTFFEGKGE